MLALAEHRPAEAEQGVVVQRKEVRDQLMVFGLETAGTTPEEMDETIRRETAKYAPLIKELGLKLN